jgi:transposase
MSVVVRHKKTHCNRPATTLGTTPGNAQISAIQLLCELATLSPDMTVRQWVAHSGLDPAHEVSGTSVRKQ